MVATNPPPSSVKDDVVVAVRWVLDAVVEISELVVVTDDSSEVESVLVEVKDSEAVVESADVRYDEEFEGTNEEFP